MRKKVEQYTGSDRTWPAAWRHKIERQGRRDPVRQDGDETPVPDSLPGDEVRLERYPLASFERRAQGLCMVSVEPRVDVDRLFGAGRAFEASSLSPREIAIAKAGMVFEVAWPLRRSPARKVARCPYHPAPHRAEPPRDQARIRQIGDAQRHIDSASHQINHLIVEL
jgi:hypothetical protein